MNTSIPSRPIVRILSACCCLMLGHNLVCSAALLFYGDEQGGLHPVLRADVNDAVSALHALAVVPSASEVGGPVVSGVLPDTKVLALQTAGETTTVEFSPDILGSKATGTGLDEARLRMILDQVRATLRQFGLEGSFRLQTGGKLLSTYLAPVTPVEPGPAVATPTSDLKASSGLAGKNIALGPSHGRFWNGSGWYWQRSDPCGFGEAVLEDVNSIRLIQFLYQYLAQDGATVHVARELNESNCCQGDTGLAWYKMCAQSWLRANGLPCSVWGSYSGNCGADTATSRSSDDIRARPLFADYRGSDIYIAHHTNAGGGGTANGTETYRDTAMEHPAHETASYNLALAVNNNVVAAIRDMYPGESGWSNRGVKDSAGGFGEIRIPNRPAILIELAFHDNCSRDAAYLTDNFFRSVAEWGLYKGICEYFGTSPTWDKYSDEYVSDTIPSTMTPGQSYNVSVTFRNRGVVWSEARAFRLGAVGDSDPFTATTRRTISGEVRPGNTYTFSFTMTAPTTPGTYTTDWRMVRDSYAWFGATHSEQVTVTGGGAGCTAGSDNNRGTTIGSYTADWQGNPTSQNFPGYATGCGYGVWYIYDRLGTSCTARGGNATWNPEFTWSGRGYIHMDFQVPCANATSQIYVRYRNTAGNYNGQTSTINECAYSTWMTPLDGDTANVGDWNGCYVNSDDSVGAPSGGCNTACNSRMTGVAQIHMYGARWHYVNDWVCLGGYSSGAVSDTHGFDEANAYFYPAIDTTHGNVIGPALFNGKVPGRVTTGDCNNANSLNFKGNAAAYGNGDNMDSYGFAWAYAPAGAGPKLLIGTDDGVRVWVNGSLAHDNNASRGLTRDQDETAGISFSSGWNRILFKVHNGSGGFEGTLSLRNGGNRHLNEPSVNVFDLGGYYSYAAGFEQDWWYPCIDVASFYGSSNPQPNSDHYGSNTTVTASGTAAGNGPVPFWKVMHFEWGHGLSGDTSYTDASSSGTSWSHSQTGVTGRRRFHFFSVSRSGRTSFQNSGVTGGWNFADGGPANYMDVYVDNAAPANPSFSTAAAASTSQINLGWAVPLDKGVNCSDGAAEYRGSAEEGGGDNAYRRGDVGVQVYRNGSAIYGWGTSTSLGDVGLSPNTAYTYTIDARDNTGESRGAWHNTTGPQGSTVVWTLSVPPEASSVTADNAALCLGDTATWTAAGGFGPGQLQKYKYAWDQNAAHTWTESEADWSSGTIQTAPTAAGTWYLHVKGYNGANVANGTYDYAITVNPLPEVSTADRPRPQGASLKIRISDLTPAPNTITSVGNATGGTVSMNNTYVFFLPADLNALTPGSFTYTAASPAACAQQAAVNVTVVPAAGHVQQIAVTNNTVTMNFAGIPGFAYAVKRSTDLVTWVTLVETNAPPAGVFQWVDDFDDLPGPPASAYYRLQQP